MNVLNLVSTAKFELPSDQDASGRTLGREELDLLEAAIRSGTLTSTKGTMVAQLEERFAQVMGARHAFACASGTAAIHCAIAAVDPEPGDEIVTSPVTDMGAITPILYQGAIPVFADVDPITGNVTAETIRACVSERTRAIVVTHLFGNPAEMGPIMALASERGIPVIEDCAQAYLSECDGRLVGTHGAIGCFSLQQGKHITTGEGGLVISNDDFLARRMQLFINKAWGYGDAHPDHYFLALNYRMTELQGAVAVAQLEKLSHGVGQRQAMAARLSEGLADLDGIELPQSAEGSSHTFWKYPLLIDDGRIVGGTGAMGAGLRSRNIACAPRYIQKPAFECAVIRDQQTFGKSRFPFTLARPEAVDYAAERFPGTYRLLQRILVLPWSERYEEPHVDYLIDCIRTQHEAIVGQSEAGQ